jgi:hypothetical protein
VTHIEPNVIQGLLDEVEKLENSITACTPLARDKFQHVRINEVRAAIVNGTAQFDAAQWSQLSEQKQQELQEELITMRGMLLEITRNGDDKNQPSLRAADSASSKPIIWLAIFGLIFAATLLSLIR